MNLSENYLTVVLPFSHGFDEGADAVQYGLSRDDVYQDVYQERADTIICLIKENVTIQSLVRNSVG